MHQNRLSLLAGAVIAAAACGADASTTETSTAAALRETALTTDEGDNTDSGHHKGHTYAGGVVHYAATYVSEGLQETCDDRRNQLAAALGPYGEIGPFIPGIALSWCDWFTDSGYIYSYFV